MAADKTLTPEDLNNYQHVLGMLILGRKAVEYYGKIEATGSEVSDTQVAYKASMLRKESKWLNLVTYLAGHKGMRSNLYQKMNSIEEYQRECKARAESRRRYAESRHSGYSSGGGSRAYYDDDDVDTGSQWINFNTDGTPMLGNSGIDYNGHTYGSSFNDD